MAAFVLTFIAIIVTCLSSNISLSDITGEHLTIHIITHTHDDPGWLITVDQYYIEEVQWIFYTMIPVLKDNPDHKFTYVEMAYMHRWWEEIDDNLKNDTIKLVQNGQFQFNLGGWCMNDEATPTANAVIHQMTDGNQFILQNFKTAALPTVAWHVDPFGHSWVTGGLWAQGGFDAFAVHRIDYLDLQRRKNDKNLEFMWKGSNSLGEDGWIFFHVLDSGYCGPVSIDFWDPPPAKTWINTDPLLPSYPPNQIELAEQFVATSRQRSQWYTHNQLLMPFGCDFAHQNSYQSMIQMDKMMDYVNSNETYNVKMIYSSLADYVKAVNDLNLTWTLEQPDFFPYRSNVHNPWTGYFTSRPLLKLYTRSRANELRVAEQFYVFAKGLELKNVDFDMGMFNITFLRDAVDVVQHHDAITGTEKQAVADEYMNQLRNGTERVGHWDESVVKYFLQKGSNIPNLPRGNDISELTENNVVVLVVYNSLAWTVTQFLQIPSNRSDLAVYDANGALIPSQINPVCDQEQNGEYPAKYNLFILAKDMGPLSLETFFIKVNASAAVVGETYIPKKDEPIKAGKGYYSLVIDPDTKRLSQISNNGIGKVFNVSNQFWQYVPAGDGNGGLDDGWKGSDCYTFRPATDNRIEIGGNGNKVDYAFRNELEENADIGILSQGHSSFGSGKEYTNSYISTICDVDISSSTFNTKLFRSDANNDNEKPVLDFFVFDNNNPSYGSFSRDQKTGSVLIKSPGSASYTTINIPFSGSEFGTSTPTVLASVRTINCDGSHYAVTIASVSNKGATFWIKRADKDTAWTDSVYLDYIAFDPQHFDESPTMIDGEFTIKIPASSSTVQQYNISLGNHPNFIVNEPVILMGIQQKSPSITSNSVVGYFATTTFSSNWTHFMLNVQNLNSLNTEIDLKISYVAFERKTLEGAVAADSDIENKLISGPLMDEIQQTFKDGYTQTFRVFNIEDDDLKFIDNRIHLGPITPATEYVTRFTTDFDTNSTFYTAQAGLEYVERVYDPYTDERVAGNYYPSSGAAYLEDTSGFRLSTIVNQGHGVGFGSTNMNGQYEIMLQRRDTATRINEILNTTSHTEPRIIILADNAENTANSNRRLYQIQQFQHSFFFGLSDSIKAWTDKYNTSWTAMNAASSSGLPDQIFLQQLRYVYSGNGNNSDIVMQLQHMFENGESSMSKNVTVDLSKILRSDMLKVVNQTEMNLFATVPLKNLQRLSWNVNDGGVIRTIRDEQSENERRKLQQEMDKDSIASLSPRDIRTFVVNARPLD